MGSVIICRLRFQLCVISLTVGIWKTLCYFKKALILATAKRHLDLASSFDREDGAKEQLLSLRSYYQYRSFFKKQNSMCCLCHKSDTVYRKFDHCALPTAPVIVANCAKHALDLKFALVCCPFCLANILILLKSTLHKGEELGRLNDFLNGLD